jgi:hypothetical protein
MLAVAYGLALVLGAVAFQPVAPAEQDASWEPAPAPPPTAWARAGARSWRLCDEAARQASAVQIEGPRGDGAAEEFLWSKRARQCPHAPEVLVMAAQAEILEASVLESASESDELDAVVAEHDERVRRAVRWLDAALVEARRRAQAEPLGARYFRAYARVALREPEAARADLLVAARTGDVEGWRADRMLALIELMLGNLDDALQLGHRGLVDAPIEDRPISRYIWVLVLDRVGAAAAARAELVALRNEPGHISARNALHTLLPVHERLYSSALDHQANREHSNALRLWEAYLSRPEPAEPERELARRHLAELTREPAPVGGPMGSPVELPPLDTDSP